MLIFVGLGLSGKGISLQGLESLERADDVYAEFYTSLNKDFNIRQFEKRIGASIDVLNREDVEQSPEKILESAGEGDVVFLVPGDPMVATTHVDLRLRAEKAGIKTRIIHAASIETAAPGLAGLQSYKFGRTATIPLRDKPSKTPYEVLEKNQRLGLHTLFLLDIEAEEEIYLTADRAVEWLLSLEDEIEDEVFTGDTLAVVVARAGHSDSLVRADKARYLQDKDFGSPPHALIVPGKLHFLEAEALTAFADAPQEVVKENVEG